MRRIGSVNSHYNTAHTQSRFAPPRLVRTLLRYVAHWQVADWIRRRAVLLHTTERATCDQSSAGIKHLVLVRTRAAAWLYATVYECAAGFP